MKPHVTTCLAEMLEFKMWIREIFFFVLWQRSMQGF